MAEDIPPTNFKLGLDCTFQQVKVFGVRASAITSVLKYFPAFLLF